MTNFSTPNAAVSGASISSTEYNANWSAVETFLNATGVPVLQDGAVSSAAKIGAGVITHAKMDSKSLGQQVTSGFARVTTDSEGAGDRTSITITGDGATPVRVQALASIASGAAGEVRLTLADGALITGNIYGRSVFPQAAANEVSTHYVEGIIPAFSGSKTIYLNVSCASGTPTTYGSSGGVPAWIRATWAPGWSTS